MTGALHIYRRRFVRYRCRRCGRPATYRVHGQEKADRRHDLCAACWQTAAAFGERRGQALLTAPR